MRWNDNNLQKHKNSSAVWIQAQYNTNPVSGNVSIFWSILTSVEAANALFIIFTELEIDLVPAVVGIHERCYVVWMVEPQTMAKLVGSNLKQIGTWIVI